MHLIFSSFPHPPSLSVYPLFFFHFIFITPLRARTRCASVATPLTGYTIGTLNLFIDSHINFLINFLYAQGSTFRLQWSSSMRPRLVTTTCNKYCECRLFTTKQTTEEMNVIQILCDLRSRFFFCQENTVNIFVIFMTLPFL